MNSMHTIYADLVPYSEFPVQSQFAHIIYARVWVRPAIFDIRADPAPYAKSVSVLYNDRFSGIRTIPAGVKRKPPRHNVCKVAHGEAVCCLSGDVHL